MFILTVMEDMVKINPDQFDRDFSDVLIEEIESKYLDRVIPDVGLCISFYDFVNIGDPYVYPSEGAVHQLVNFRLIVYRPFPTEICVGTIIECNNDGLKVSMGFFDNIIIPNNLLQTPSVYDASEASWRWQYSEDVDDDSPPFTLTKGDTIRFAVRTLTFTKSYTNSKGVQSFTTSTSLTGTNSGTRDGSVLTGRDRSNSSGSTSSLRMRSTSNASDMSGYTSDTSSGLRKRSASIDQVLTSNPAVDETDAITKKMSETNVPPVDETQALPSQHHPMRVIGCIDGDGLGLLTWW